MVAPITHSDRCAHWLTGVTDLVRVDLTGPDADDAVDPVLQGPRRIQPTHPGDTFARRAVDRIDFSWSSLKIADLDPVEVTVRTAQYDIWAANS